MDNSLARLRKEFNIPMSDMVEIVKTRFPKFDKPLLSKCMHPEDYGIQVLPQSDKELFEIFDPAGRIKRRSQDRHRFSRSIRCRLDEETYQALISIIRREGYATTQGWLSAAVKAFIRAKEKP